MTPEQLEARHKLDEGTAHFYAREDEKAAQCFLRAMELEPEGLGSTYLGTTYATQFLPGCLEAENFTWIDRAVEVFAEIAERHPVLSIRENGQRQLAACIYLRDNSPQPS